MIIQNRSYIFSTRIRLVMLLIAFAVSGQSEKSPVFPMFADQQQTRLIPDIQDVYGAGFRDLNGDGRVDLYLVCFRGVNRLLINQGPGFPFQDATVESGLGGNLMPMDSLNLELGTVLADFDNDGDGDVLIAGWGETLTLFQNEERLRFRVDAEQIPLFPPVDANAAITADVNGDGWLDIFITDEHFPNYLLIHTGKNKFIESSAEWGLIEQDVSQGAAFCDVDGDGDQDLYVCNWMGPDRFYQNIEETYFRRMDLDLASLNRVTNTNAPCFGDIDNDGDFDLIVTHREGTNFIYRNDTVPGDTAWSFQDISLSSGLGDTGKSYGCVLADFDHDGWQDVFITNIGPNHFYKNLGRGLFQLNYSDSTRPGQVNTAYSTGTAVADVDDDGDLDLFVANKDTFSLLYLNPLNDSAYIKVKVFGSESNRDGIGSRITVYSNGHGGEDAWLLAAREVQGGGGYLSVNDLTVHFGLDTVSLADIQVRFPSGRIVSRNSIRTGQLITIYEERALGRWWHQASRWIYRLTLRNLFWNELLLLALYILMVIAVMRTGRVRYAWHVGIVGIAGIGFLGFAMLVMIVLNAYPLHFRLLIIDGINLIFGLIILIYGERVHQLHLDRERYRHVLVDLGNQVTSIHDDRELLSMVVRQLVRTTEFSRCCIMLYDADTHQFEVLHCEGCDVSLQMVNALPLEKELKTVRSGQFVSNRENSDSGLVRLFQCDYLVSLQRSRFMGIMTLGAQRGIVTLSPEDKALFRTLANQLGVALENNDYIRQSNEMIQKLTEAKVREVYLEELESANALLDQKNQALQKLYNELKQTESQLIQSEKMASLGQLIAGISHELNNPVSFIYANLKELKSSIKKIEQASRSTSVNSPDFLQDIECLIQDALTGSRMVKTLVEHLRRFSHLDQAERKVSNIHEGIETCLMILTPQLKENIQVHCQFNSTGLFECNIGQLNQVFLNILSNAAQAIDKSGEIWILTEDTEDGLCIRIRDNGRGIPKDEMSRIFDPFYTTKDVGEGTGLGLSISYAIIKQHQGEIQVNSDLGKGTEISLFFPKISV